jgi:Tat protein secretion system quality control protein TatD with DNase activity
LPKIASRIAELLGVSYSSLCSQTTANTIAFFKTM